MNEIASTNLESVGKRRIASARKKTIAKKQATGREKSKGRKVAHHGKT